MRYNLAFTNYSCDKMCSLCVCVSVAVVVFSCIALLIEVNTFPTISRSYWICYSIEEKKCVTQQQHAFIFLRQILYSKCRIHCAHSLSPSLSLSSSVCCKCSSVKVKTKPKKTFCYFIDDWERAFGLACMISEMCGGSKCKSTFDYTVFFFNLVFTWTFTFIVAI